MFVIVLNELADGSTEFLVVNKLTNDQVASYTNYEDAWLDITSR